MFLFCLKCVILFFCFRAASRLSTQGSSMSMRPSLTRTPGTWFKRPENTAAVPLKWARWDYSPGWPTAPIVGRKWTIDVLPPGPMSRSAIPASAIVQRNSVPPITSGWWYWNSLYSKISSGHRVQQIDVHYNFIGEIDLLPEFSRYSKRTTA